MAAVASVPLTAATPKDTMAAKLRTEAGKALYARRKVIVEPVFGQIKGVRGFRRFLLRGLAKVRDEWRIVCLTHNPLKIWRYRLRRTWDLRDRKIRIRATTTTSKNQGQV